MLRRCPQVQPQLAAPVGDVVPESGILTDSLGDLRLGRGVRAHHDVGFLDEQEMLRNRLAPPQVGLVAFVGVLVDAGHHQADDELLQRPVIAELPRDDRGFIRGCPVSHRCASRLPKGAVVDPLGQELFQLVDNAFDHAARDVVFVFFAERCVTGDQGGVQVLHTQVRRTLRVHTAVFPNDAHRAVSVQQRAFELVKTGGSGGIRQ